MHSRGRSTHSHWHVNADACSSMHPDDAKSWLRFVTQHMLQLYEPFTPTCSLASAERVPFLASHICMLSYMLINITGRNSCRLSLDAGNAWGHTVRHERPALSIAEDNVSCIWPPTLPAVARSLSDVAGGCDLPPSCSPASCCATLWSCCAARLWLDTAPCTCQTASISNRDSVIYDMMHVPQGFGRLHKMHACRCDAPAGTFGVTGGRSAPALPAPHER